MRGFSGLSDFFLRKAFKFALKRNLGKYLASELDLNQLDVQLGQGTIELRQLLLNCNELNEQLVSQTESPHPSVIMSPCHSAYCHAAFSLVLTSCHQQQLHTVTDVLRKPAAPLIHATSFSENLPALIHTLLNQHPQTGINSSACRTLPTGRLPPASSAA